MKFRNIEFTEHTIPYVRVSTYKSLKKKPSDIYEEHMEKESSSDATSERILFQERRHNTFLNERVTLESGKVLDNNIINDYNKFKSLCKVKRRLMNFTEREKENQILDLSIPTPDTYQYKNGTQWKEFTTFWLTQCLMPNESLKIELNTNIFAGNISEAHPLKLSLEYLAGNPYTKKTLDSKLGKAASKTFKVTIDGSEVPYETFGHYYRKYLVNNVGNKENIIIEIKNIGKKRVPIVYLYLNYPTSGKRELAHFETSENGVQQITRQVIQGNSSNNGITLYPNPVSSTLNISGDAEAVSGSIYTAQGQHVMDISDLANGIDVSHLKAGAYSFIMKDKNGKTQQRKFLKK